MKLPDLDPPTGAWLAFEQIAVDGDSRGNFRWYLAQDGSWYQAANRGRTAPDGLWVEPYPNKPLRRFDAAAMERIREAAEAVDLRRLSTQPVSSPVVQRWALVGATQTVSAVVAPVDRPGALEALATAVDDAVMSSA